MTASRPSPAAPTHEVRFVTLIGAKHETLDEVVGTGDYHAEIMDDDYLWLQLGPDMFAVHATKGRFGRPRLTFSLTEKNAFAASAAPESAPPTETEPTLEFQRDDFSSKPPLNATRQLDAGDDDPGEGARTVKRRPRDFSRFHAGESVRPPASDDAPRWQFGNGVCPTHGKAVLVTHIDGEPCTDYLTPANAAPAAPALVESAGDPICARCNKPLSAHGRGSDGPPSCSDDPRDESEFLPISTPAVVGSATAENERAIPTKVLEHMVDWAGQYSATTVSDLARYAISLQQRLADAERERDEWKEMEEQRTEELGSAVADLRIAEQRLGELSAATIALLAFNTNENRERARRAALRGGASES